MLTRNPNINVLRVLSRMETGGHGVPADKVISRYYKCLALIPKIYDIADTFYLFDNSIELTRIAIKKSNKLELRASEVWKEEDIKKLLGI